MRILLVIICLFASTLLNAEAVLHPIQGNPIPLSQLQGKWILINYWASWCQHCVDEIPELNQFYDQHKNENVALFAVNYDMLPAEMQQQLIDDYDIHYPGLIENPSSTLNLGEIRGVPVTFVINPQGLLTQRIYGGLTIDRLSRIIKSSS